MSNRDNWKRIEKNELRKRWSNREYLFILKEFKKNKKISPAHPRIDDKYDFIAVNLRKTRLQGLNINNADFDFGQFYGTIIRDIRAHQCSFLESDLCSSDIAFGNFLECCFSNSRIINANLYKARFRKCDFSGCDMTLTDYDYSLFEECLFSDTSFYQIKNLSTSIFDRCVFDRCTIDKNTLCEEPISKTKELFTKEIEIMDYDYHVAISFAGDDREYASKLASALRKRDVKVFFDEFETAKMWGKNLYDYLTDIYRTKAQHCIMIISKAYANKAWPNLERKSAQARVFETTDEYLLPIRLDDTEIKGILPTIAYINSKDYAINEIVTMVKKKLGM